MLKTSVTGTNAFSIQENLAWIHFYFFFSKNECLYDVQAH
jgi:hypothetical protein